jgi:hypothetical protein
MSVMSQCKSKWVRNCHGLTLRSAHPLPQTLYVLVLLPCLFHDRLGLSLVTRDYVRTSLVLYGCTPLLVSDVGTVGATWTVTCPLAACSTRLSVQAGIGLTQGWSQRIQLRLTSPEARGSFNGGGLFDTSYCTWLYDSSSSWFWLILVVSILGFCDYY